MLLVIDVGNTNTVAGIYDGKKLVDNWRFSSDRSKTADEFGMFMNSMLNFSGLKKELVTDIIISSVVPPVLVPLCHMCDRFFKIKPMVVGQVLLILYVTHLKRIHRDRMLLAVTDIRAVEIAADSLIRVTCINHHHIGTLLNQLAHHGIGRKTLTATRWPQTEEIAVVSQLQLSFLTSKVNGNGYTLSVGVIHLQGCHLVMLHAFLIKETQG